MEWGYLIRLPKNTYKYILLYPAHMFLTVGMTLGIRVPVVGPLKDINFQKHSGAPLAVLVYIYGIVPPRLDPEIPIDITLRSILEYIILSLEPFPPPTS
jgi:hypothetical protein